MILSSVSRIPTCADNSPEGSRIWCNSAAILNAEHDMLCMSSMRHQVDQLLLALWADPACKTSLSAVAQAANAGTGGAASEHLVAYARAVLNNLMYTLKARNSTHSTPYTRWLRIESFIVHLCIH